MSVLIAYLVIGLVNAVGLILDQAERISFNPDSIIDWVTHTWVVTFIVVAWPLFFYESNKKEPRHDA